MDHRARNVLLCLRYGIGDVVMETPVLEALRRALPEARITALGAAPAMELLERDPRLHAVQSIQEWGLRHRWDPGPPEVRRAIGEWLDHNAFDLFLDVHHAAPPLGEIIWGRGIRSLEADEAEESRAVAAGRDGVSAIKAAVRAGWGIEVPEDLLPALRLDDEDHRFAARFLQDHAADGSAPVALSPVASLSMKRWPAARFAALADRVLQLSSAPLLLFCGPQAEEAEQVLSRMRHRDRVVCVGSLHLRRVAALLAACRAFVCNDTGLMHIAAAVETPTIGIFGPTPPSVYRPPAPHATSVGGTGFECAYRNTASLHPPGCWGEDRCLIGETGCIHRPSEEEVLAALHHALHRTRPLAAAG